MSGFYLGKMGWVISLFLLGLFSSSVLYAQPKDAVSAGEQGVTTCRRTLENTQSLYDNGDVLPIPKLLVGCIEQRNALTREETIRAQKLVTLSYIFSDAVPQSEWALESLLRTDPVHELDPASDPKELFYLYHKFRTDPIFRIRIYGGGNYTMFNGLERYGVENLGTQTETITSGIRGYFGSSFDKEFLNHFELSMGLQFEFREFSLNNQLYDYSSYQLSESQLSFSAPLYLRYLFAKRGKAHPYLSLGWVPNLLIASTLTGSREGNTVVNIESQNLLQEGIRQQFSHAAIGGIGVRFLSRNKRGFLFMETLYYYGLSSFTRGKNRFNVSQDIPFRLGYVDDNFSLNGIQFSMGYIVSLYKPKKLRRYRKQDKAFDNE